MYPCGPSEVAQSGRPALNEGSLFTHHLVRYMAADQELVYIARLTAHYCVLQDTSANPQHPRYEESIKATDGSVTFTAWR